MKTATEGQSFPPIAILGAGSWGTAMALYLSRRGQTVNIWSIEKSEIDGMLKDKANNRYHPGIELPDGIKPMSDLASTVHGVKDIVMVVPSVGFRDTLTALKPLINADARIVCASKGIDEKTDQLLNRVTEEVLGKNHAFAVLSGPSFAKEVAKGLPCAVAIASKDKKFRQDLSERFSSPIFHVEPSDDVTGTELGGVAKNVIAIATGIFDGMQMGSNARSALITRGLAEIAALGMALGAKRETFVGLAGLGDLILTCSDDQSRNRRLGLAIGKGKNIAEAEKEIGQAIEGKTNAILISKLAEHHGVQMPICKIVSQIVTGQISAKDGVQQLLDSEHQSYSN